MIDWTVVDIPMLAMLPVLLLVSGFFSGSETALFGLTENQRMLIRRQQTLSARAIEALLSDQRMLLITVLLGNMTINVLYFVISSVLLMRAEAGLAVGLLLAAAFLLLIILLGEVVPKLVANAGRPAFAAVIAPPLLALHKLIGPLRIGLNRLVVAPLSRLTSPAEAPPRLDEGELAALLDVSTREGVIDLEEQQVLQDVIALSQRKVRDVMTPRVRIEAVPVTASRDEVTARARKTRLTIFPAYRDDLDHIVGLLHVKRYLLDPREGEAVLTDHVTLARFVPEVATLDQLLDHFRESRTHLAIVVDEFGGTAGIVAIEDVVEELVGDIASKPGREEVRPEPIGPNQWRVGGDASVHEWASAFGPRLIPPRVSTLGGLITARLGRAPHPGDSVELGNVRVDVEQVDRSRVVTAIVTLTNGPDNSGEAP
ncbi:MAG: hemolysin family protein [Planctomycetota bacterium]|jgi:CBS domain containing-hemolysin-like protein